MTDEWLATVPGGWSLMPLKRVAHCDNSGAWGEEPGRADVDGPVATTAQIDPDGAFRVDDMPVRSFTHSDFARYSCIPGQIIVVKSSGSASNIISGKAGLVRDGTRPFIFSNFLMRLTVRENILPRFLYDFLISHVVTERIRRMVSATTYPNLRVDEYLSSEIPVPPLEVQRAIADSIDAETMRIDGLIAAKRRMMELLEERKGSIREGAISAARMSSPPVRLSHLAREVDARLGDADPPELLSVSIHSGVVPFAEANPNREARADDLFNYKRCETGDLILNRMRAFQGGLGCAPQAGVVSPDYAVLRPVRGVDPEYLFHLMRSPWFVGQMESCLRGIGSVDQGNVRTPRVNWNDLKVLRVPLPDHSDQRRIAKTIAQGIAATRTAQDTIARQIDVLSERRQAFITAAVTGHCAVPGAL